MSYINQAPDGSIFPAWENHLEHEAPKPVEIKKVIEKLDYKGKQKVKKELEIRSFVIKRKVTKEYLERRKIKPFGIGTNEDDLRQNVNLTSIQRENVWHPYYEIKLEEEDFKDKYQKAQKEKKEKAMGNTEIEEIENKLKGLEEKERQDQKDQQDAAEGKKKGFDIKKIQDKKREEEKQQEAIPQEDFHTIKLRNISNDITEEDIYASVIKFGEIIKVKIPQEEMRNGKQRNRGFAFVTFKSIESASHALQEGEITVQFATLEIERALKRAAPPRDAFSKPSEFDMLKRRT